MVYRAVILFALLVAIFSSAAGVQAATPASETLLPPTTKGYVSIPDVDELRKQFDATQLGQLFRDPAMQLFIDDFKKQIRDRMTAKGIGIGITWDDLDGVYGGEVALATIQPNGDRRLAAMAMLCDTTGHEAQAQALLTKIDTNFIAKKAVKSAEKFGNVTLTIYTHPIPAGERVARVSVYAWTANLLVACDHLDTTKEILTRLAAQQPTSLATVEGYAGVKKQVKTAAGETPVHLRWWIEPFGYAEVTRVLNGQRRPKKEDMVKILRNQGFDAVQGLGGIVAFNTSGHEITHHTFVFAPKDPQAEGEDKYRLAARMLDFPNDKEQEPEQFAPRELATYMTFNWRMKTAFDYIGSLIDEVADEPGLFEDILESLERDPNGPKINVRKELVAHLGSRVSVLTDYILPITPKSERIAVAIEVTDTKAIEAVVAKEMKTNKQAREIKLPNGRIIWEIVKEEKVDAGGIEIAGPEDDLVAGGEDEEEEEALLPNSAVTVIGGVGVNGGYLIIGSHVDFLAKLHEARPTDAQLGVAADRALVNKALNAMKLAGQETEALRYFSRTDENIRPTYELIRAGQMPQAETMLARLLNRMLTDENAKEGTRKQLIDGSKLPEFEVARRYLGPAGAYVHGVDDGWLISGCLLTKDAGPIVVARQPEDVPASAPVEETPSKE